MRYDDIDDSFFGVVAVAVSKHMRATDEQLKNICLTITELSGGDVIYISKQYKNKLSRRNHSIKKDFLSGETKPRLESKYLLSRHQINRILKA